MASAASTPAKSSRKRGGGRAAGGGGDDDAAVEYEKQRLSRIRENQERLEALGLRSLASALLGTSGSGGKQGEEEEKRREKKKKKKKKKGHGGYEDDEDDEYQPSEEDEGGGSSSFGEEKEEQGEEGHASPPGARQRSRGKGQKKISSNTVKIGKNLPIQPMDELHDIDDAALQQAIAISLEGPLKCSGAGVNMVSQISTGDFVSAERQGKNNVNSTQGTRGGGKRRKVNVTRPQMTEDESVAYFFSFDEAGKGGITLRDLTRMAFAHDFCWTDKEIADMIYLFDSNRDGQLSLDDFRAIVARCNMMRESGNG